MINKFKQFWKNQEQFEEPETFKKHWIGMIKKEDNVKWITVRGSHIPIKNGQDAGDAIKEHFDSLKDKKKENESKNKTEPKKISDAFDDYKYDSKWDNLKASLEKYPKEAKEIAEQSKKFLLKRNIKTLYRAGSKDGISWSYTRSGAMRFANPDKNSKVEITELKVTPDVLERVQIVEGITGSSTRNEFGENEVILKPKNNEQL